MVDWYKIENAIGDQFVQTSTGTGIPVTRQWESALRDALTETLTFRDGGEKKLSLLVYVQKAEMNGIVSIDFRVAAKYRLLDRGTGKESYSKTIESVGTADTSEAFVGATRARLAFVRAVRINIERFLADIDATALR